MKKAASIHGSFDEFPARVPSKGFSYATPRRCFREWMKNARTFASMLANVRQSQPTCQQARKNRTQNASWSESFSANILACLPYCRAA